MRSWPSLRTILSLLPFLLVTHLAAQTVTNVRAKQLTDGTKRVEILYDLSGAPAGGATVTIAISSDGGTTYTIAPTAGSLGGNVGAGVTSGTNRRILWNPAGAVPAGTHGKNYRAAVTATPPQGGGQEVTYTLPGGVELVVVRIPAGTFQMGSPETERGRFSNETLHPVTLTSDYYLGKYEVTHAQWAAVMGTNLLPSYTAGWPVELVSWDEIRGPNGFIAKLNQLLGTAGFRLPTEAEWERAARGGTQTRFSFGDALDGADDGCGANAAAEPYVWWCQNSEAGWQVVGTKSANPYGLRDMHGNVWEWVEDWYGSYPTTAQIDPTGPSSGSGRVHRSGGWGHDLVSARSAMRSHIDPGASQSDLGFRLARSQ
ncbi:MAG: formylglycine-generating enzyme family protein [Thermoanaerobaculia bacterium]